MRESGKEGEKSVFFMLFVWKQKFYSRSLLGHLLARHFLVQIAVWGDGVDEVLKATEFALIRSPFLVSGNNSICPARFSVCGSHMNTADPRQNGTKQFCIDPHAF